MQVQNKKAEWFTEVGQVGLETLWHVFFLQAFLRLYNPSGLRIPSSFQ